MEIKNKQAQPAFVKTKLHELNAGDTFIRSHYDPEKIISGECKQNFGLYQRLALNGCLYKGHMDAGGCQIPCVSLRSGNAVMLEPTQEVWVVDTALSFSFRIGVA